MGRRKRSAPTTPREAVEALLNHDRICWFPVKHYSPACALHVREVIEALQPDCVLVEGPDDATPCIDALVHPDTVPPVCILSTWVDQKNEHGLAGRLSPSPDVPVRFRGWWPFVRYSPEYVALRAGREVGAELAFIDAPLRATLPFSHARKQRVTRAVTDQQLSESAYFEALRTRQRRRDFEEFWEANFEVGGIGGDTLEFMRAVLLFAWCTRNVSDPKSFDDDGTHLREQHMAWHIREARKRHDGWIVVVTGAFHSVALPFAKPRRAKAKADRHTTTLLCAHSYPALSRLYRMNTQPAYGDAVWEALEEASPHGSAAMRTLVEVMSAGRAAGLPVSTADAVGGWRAARELASLRGNAAPTRHDLLDAIQMAYVKGEHKAASLELMPIARRILVGSAMGTVTETAGRAPLLGDFYQAARSHRLDLSGEHKVVRCDLGKHAKHRRKSAFLHQCDLLGLPMFASTDRKDRWGSGPHFKGPNPITGENMHLIGETWGIRWTEEVDDRLLELSDRGSSVARVAGSLLEESVKAARGDASVLAGILVQTTQMMLLDHYDAVLTSYEDALVVEGRFAALVAALMDLQLLTRLESGDHERTLDALETTYNAAVLRIPARVEAEVLRETTQALQDLVRTAVTFEPRPLDVDMLARQLEAILDAEDLDVSLHGAALGVLFTLGRRNEHEIADALRSVLMGSDVGEAGRFLEGLFTAGKAVLLSGERLLVAIDEVIRDLDWPTFRRILPDLRRAFTQFIPSELDTLGSRVSAVIGLSEPPDRDRPVPAGLVSLVREMDGRVCRVLAGWDG